ncbi:MAG: hypothetical protein WC346_21810 [Methanogenium sp.]|jgi:hypothetical protein
MKRTGKIIIVRTEQWEYTAYYGRGKKMLKATGSSETSAERNLLRLMVFGDVNHWAWRGSPYPFTSKIEKITPRS